MILCYYIQCKVSNWKHDLIKSFIQLPTHWKKYVIKILNRLIKLGFKIIRVADLSDFYFSHLTTVKFTICKLVIMNIPNFSMMASRKFPLENGNKHFFLPYK